MSNQRTSEMDALLKQWQKSRDYGPIASESPKPEDGPPFFCNDGVLCEDIWENEKPKIAFILKESNDKFYNIRGKPGGPGGSSGRFWRHIRMWSYTVKQLLNGKSVTFKEAEAEKEKPVDHIAYINLKKKCQNEKKSKKDDIHKYVADDWEEFTEKQISLTNPDVLFCGGTYGFISARLKAVPCGKKVYRWGQRLVIDFCHPSWQRETYETYFERLKEMIESIRSTSI